jgi:hypothetical protein
MREYAKILYKEITYIILEIVCTVSSQSLFD